MNIIRRKSASGTAALVYFGFLLIMVGGWIANIVKLVNLPFAGNEGWFVVRVIGIVTGPVGSVLGYL